MILSFINIRKVTREAHGFQHFPRDLANVNEWEIMFDPSIIIPALINMDVVAYTVSFSTNMPLECTFQKLYSLARNSGYPNKILFTK